jgi:hypothetical protein
MALLIKQLRIRAVTQAGVKEARFKIKHLTHM